jgi:hypothetical protein
METHTINKRTRMAETDGIDRLEAHLQSQLNGRVCGLHLLAAGQGLILRGHAHTYYAKQIAQHLVMEATELPILANEIEVS